jgi:putative ABC transport system substrate-binding protein
MLAMRRREFIRLLGGAAASSVLWPLATRAEQPALPVIGFLNTRSADTSAHLVAAFQRGLAENGYAEGRNLTVAYRWANGQYEQLPAMAAELARRPVTVLAATGGDPAALAAKAATTTIPVVATLSADPVEHGLVTSLNKPGGNVTGVSNLTSTLEPKRLGLLRDLLPQATGFGVLVNTSWPMAANQLSDIEQAARTLGMTAHVLRASTDEELDAAFASAAQQRLPALAVASDAFFNSRREKIAALAARHGLPAMYTFRDYAVAGGLMSYGIDLPDVYRHIGVYVGRILKGAKVSELPVIQPTRFELVINLKTAKALGLAVPDRLLAIADEVIE